ncbi:MAG: hypothetical protein ABIC04_03945 [Nanoarchaeota archaeon]
MLYDALICYVDEKYETVKDKWHYWWILKDMLGNILSLMATKSGDLDFVNKFAKIFMLQKYFQKYFPEKKPSILVDILNQTFCI